MFSDQRMHELNTMIDQISSTYKVAGLALAVVDKQGIVWQKLCGYRNVAEQKELNADTILGLASLTKSFTALATLILADRGIIDLQQSVSTYLPEFKYPGQGVVTIAHLLSHSAGYAPLPRILATDLIEQGFLPADEPQDPALSPSFAAEGGRRVIDRLNAPPFAMLGRPGEYMSYFNDGFATLSELIRRHGGYPTYAEFVQNEILIPLGMNRSRYDALSLADEDNCTTLYYPQQGELKNTEDWHLNGFALMGGGSLKSTLNDMAQYVRMYLNKGRIDAEKHLISSFMISEMQKPRIRYSHLRYYGYGLYTGSLDDISVVGHGGSLPGVATDMMWSHDLGLGVLVLCNTSEVPVAKLSQAMMKCLNGHSAEEARVDFQDKPWDEATIEAACGEYVSGEGGRFIIRKNASGQPELLTGGMELQLRPVLPDLALAQVKLNTVEYRLYRHENGDVWALGAGGRMVFKI